MAGKLAQAAFLTLSAERAVYSVWVLLTIAAGILVYSLITGDFRMAYVAETSNRDHADALQVRGVVGRPGRLAAVLDLAALHLRGRRGLQNRRKFRDMMPYVIAVLMTIEAFFLILITFVASPFKVLVAGKGIVDAGRWPRA